MIKRFLFSFVLLLSLFVYTPNLYAQNGVMEFDETQESIPVEETLEQSAVLPKETFYRAKVVDVMREGTKNLGGYQQRYQVVKLQLLNGDEKGKEITFEHGAQVNLNTNQLVEIGQVVVVVKIPAEDETYQIIDTYRLPQVGYLIAAFFLVVLVLSRWKGLGSIAGMIVSLLIITYFVVPRIINGSDPLLISIVGSSVILIVTMYLAHGFSKRTSIAIGSIVVSLILTGILAVLFVEIAKLTGVSNEETGALQFGELSDLNFKGLLLGGIIIGALGVLDDITTSLTASVFEIFKANPKMKFQALLKSGMEIGKEHVSSLVNTLVLAYAGASLPMFLFIVLNPNNYPIWMILNSEMIVEEVVRTLAGSLGLIFAVPITTAMAAFFVKSK